MRHVSSTLVPRAILLILGAGLVHCSGHTTGSEPGTGGETTGNEPGASTGDSGKNTVSTKDGSPSTEDATASNAGDDAGSCGAEPTGVDASSSVIAACFPDHDGINGGDYTFDLTVDDTGFSKTILATQKPHGFVVECTSVTPAYPTVPAGCPSLACFPSNSTIAPLAPGESTTITFDTPTPDGLLYPFRSSEPSDCAVPGLNGENNSLQWSLM
jgi:hypothetical protein